MGTITLEHVGTKEMAADGVRKGLKALKHKEL